MADDTPGEDEPARRVVRKVEKLTKEGKTGEAVEVVQTIMARFHHGPLPAVEDYAGYEHVCPGAAARILAMAEKEQANRHGSNRRDSVFQYLLKMGGQLAAVLTVAAFVAVTAFAIHEHQPVPATIIGGGMLAVIVRLFLVSSDGKAATPKPPAPATPARGRRRTN